MSQLVLNAERVFKSYGKTEAVRDISLSLEQGVSLALLGQNGAGKSTLCEIFEGLLEADAGKIEIFGYDIRKNRETILEKIGVSLQQTALYKKFTVQETLELFASFYQDPADIEDLLRELDLLEIKGKGIEELSGGQKQRVYLACALVNNPKLIFLDEPTTGLDPKSRRAIWDFLLRYKEKGGSIFLTTHFMEEAVLLSDQIAIMDHGSIIACGTSESLISEYCPESKALISNAMTSVQSSRLNGAFLEDVFLKLTGRSFHDA